MTGANLLATYLAETRMSQADFCRMTGFDDGMVSRWLAGKRRPGFESAVRLEKFTDGRVPALSWMRPRRRAA